MNYPAASEYFTREIGPADVVWAYSGVRPLYDDHATAAQEATRDYVIEDEKIDGAPLLNIFGGKITTYRRLAEAMLEKIGAGIGARGAPWTEDAPLPGGDFSGSAEDFANRLRAEKPFLPEALALRLARSYGTLAREILGDAKSMSELGRDFGAGLTEAELDYLVAREWARTAEDVLWRRTKLGLHGAASSAEAIDAYLKNKIKVGTETA